MVKRFRLLAVVLTATLLASTAGCSGGAGTSAVAPVQNSNAGASGNASTPTEKIKISWLIAGDQNPYKEDNPVEKAIEEKFPNLDLTVLKINAMDNEKLNTTLASGTIPDVLVKWDVAKYYQDGVIRSITKEMVEKNMPNTVAAMREATGEAFWVKATDPVTDTLMAVPQFTIAGDARLSEIIRKDWLENLGMEVPKTLDEYHEVLRRFTFDDPDQNGRDDTYGTAAAGMHSNPMSAFFYYSFGAYGVEPLSWQMYDGKVQCADVTEGYKQGLKTISSWYKEGLIDPEFPTLQNTDATNKLLNGVYGVYSAHPSYLDPNNPTGWIQISKEHNPKAEFELFAPVTGPEGKSGTRTYGSIGDWGVMFGINATDEQVELAMQVADYVNSDEDMFRMTFYGVEGEHYDIDANKVVTPRTGFTEAEFGIKCFRTASYIDWDIYKVFTAPEVIKLVQTSMDYPLIPNAVDPNQVKLLAGDAADNTEIDKLVKEFYFNAITGKIDIDAEWDGYVKKYMDLGGTALTEAASRAPRVD